MKQKTRYPTPQTRVQYDGTPHTPQPFRVWQRATTPLQVTVIRLLFLAGLALVVANMCKDVAR
jgi:hypothetical protein